MNINENCLNHIHLLEDDIRKEVESMCNLSQGIVDDTRAEVIMSMHKKGYSLEQIADVMEKSVEEVEDIIRQEELVTV